MSKKNELKLEKLIITSITPLPLLCRAGMGIPGTQRIRSQKRHSLLPAFILPSWLPPSQRFRVEQMSQSLMGGVEFERWKGVWWGGPPVPRAEYWGVPPSVLSGSWVVSTPFRISNSISVKLRFLRISIDVIQSYFPPRYIAVSYFVVAVRIGTTASSLASFFIS